MSAGIVEPLAGHSTVLIMAINIEVLEPCECEAEQRASEYDEEDEIVSFLETTIRRRTESVAAFTE